MGSIAVVGSVAYDSVETPFGKVTEVLGGAATYFSIAAGYFTDVRMVAAVGNDFRQQDVSLLESRNIDLAGLETLPGRTFRWAGKYGYDLNDCQTLDTQLNVLADFRPNLPEHYRTSEYLFLGNFDPVLQRQVLLQVRQPKLVACDTMNYWIQEHFPSLLETLKGVGILLINDAEARQLSREPNLVRAAEKILGWGPRILVVKRGEYGALMFRREAGGGLDIFGCSRLPAGRRAGSDRRRRHFRRRLHGLSGRDRPVGPPRPPASRHLRLRHGQLHRRRLLPGPPQGGDPHRDRDALPGTSANDSFRGLRPTPRENSLLIRTNPS